jgi:hypothetical protein
MARLMQQEKHGKGGHLDMHVEKGDFMTVHLISFEKYMDIHISCGQTRKK